MQEMGAIVKNYHGGSLTGVDLKKLFRKSHHFIRRLKKLCKKRLEERNNDPDDNINIPPSYEEVCQILDDHKNLFWMQEAVYLSARLTSPSKKEIERTRALVNEMKELWKKKNFSITTKAHLLFEHLVDQMERFHGIGDKTEDFCERNHQEQSRYSRITSRMPVGEGMLLDMRMDRRRNDPEIKRQIREVEKATSRKKDKRETNEEAYKRKLTSIRKMSRRRRKSKAKKCQRMAFKIENAKNVSSEGSVDR